MALTYEIDPRDGVIRLIRTHHPSFAEWRGLVESMLTDPAFKPGLAILDDRREDRETPPRSEVEAVAAWIRANADRLGAIKWAIVLDASARAAFGMARAAELLADTSSVKWRVFTSYEDARAWATGAEATT